MVVPPGAGALWAVVALGLLTLCTLPSGSGAVRPSDHGLGFQKNTTGAATPAMAAFFRGDGGAGAALPEARNATGFWEARATPIAVDGRRNRLRTVLLTVAVACGAAGVALLAGVAVVYLIHARREKARRRGNVVGAAAGAPAGTCEGPV